jgi:hypothetical protein
MLVDGAFAEAIDGDDYIVGGLCPNGFGPALGASIALLIGR